MLNLRTFFILGTLILLSGLIPSYGLTFYSNSFPNQKPVQILNDQKDRFYVDFGSQVYVFDNKIRYVVKIQDPDRRYSADEYHTQVSSKGVVHSLFRSSYRPRNSKTTYYNIKLATCHSSSCKYKKIVSYQISNNGGSRYGISSFDLSKYDNLFFVLSHNYRSGKNSRSELVYYYNGRKQGSAPNQISLLRWIPLDIKRSNRIHPVEASFIKLYNKNFPTPTSGIRVNDPKRLGSRSQSIDETSFLVENSEADTSLSSRYSRQVVWDRNQIPHIFVHDPSDRQFYHLLYVKGEGPRIQAIDASESGQENAVFTTKNEIWSLHYFYRDPFNKGLLATVSKNDGMITKQFVIDASKTRNAGWDLVGGQSSKGRVLFSYLTDKHNAKRVFVLLRTPSELRTIGDNFAKHGHPQGKGFLKVPPQERQLLISELTSSHLKQRKAFNLNLGTGVQLLSWNQSVSLPNDPAEANPYRPNYQYSGALLNMISLEGNYEDTNFGIDILSKMVDDEIAAQGEKQAQVLQKIKAEVGFEKLFFHYDVKLSMDSTSVKALFSDGSGQLASQGFTVNFEEFKISLLDFRRYHFGILTQKYNLYQPFAHYRLYSGDTSYTYLGQVAGEIDVTNAFLHFGYSTLDYLIKYETEISDLFFDSEFRAGFSKVYSKALGSSEDVTSPINAYAAQIEVGWIWYKRWESLAGLGGVIKASYRFDYASFGSSDRPPDQDSPANSTQNYFGYQRTELRHGPILFASLNF